MGKNRIKTELLIHDIKVPVSVIDAGVKSLLNKRELYGKLTEKQEKVLNRILRNTKNTQRLVNDILELGRSSEGVMNFVHVSISFLVIEVLVEVFDLINSYTSELIKNATSLEELQKIVASEGITLAFKDKLWARKITIDEAKVKQIFRNLVTNAFKYRSEAIEITGYIENNSLFLRVKDDGRGVPSDHQQKIFASYFSDGASVENAVKSHGVGLAGVMVLLKDMEGDLFLESEEGKGAEFIVRIPL